MQTKYTHTLLVAVPEDMLSIGNQLAQQLGENPEADANTFVHLTHERDGVKYAIAYTVITAGAKTVVDGATFPEGILCAVDVGMTSQFDDWGLVDVGAIDTDLNP